MEGAGKIHTWHDILKEIIEDPHQKQRIAQEMHIHPLTLARWANKEAKPREGNIRQLLKIIPHNMLNIFIQLLSTDFPSLAQTLDLPTNSSPELPSAIYVQVLNASAQTPEALRPDGIYNLILQQAIKHLDPHHLGMAISIVQCMPPAHGTQVRSLREIAGIGTPPWKRDLERKMLFLGVESLAGAAVTKCHLIVVHRREEPLSFAHWTTYEQSAVACPIRSSTKIMGSLLVASAYPHYFTETHLALIEHYANLSALAFEPEDFYESKDIALRLMPHDTIQQLYFHNLRHRITQKLMEATAAVRHLTLQQAQQQVWQEIEEELLQRALDGRIEPL